MVEVEFIYKQQKINIQSNMNNIFEEIIQKYIDKTNLDINNIYFLANGRNINREDKLENIMSESDKRKNKIIVLVYSINSTIHNENTNIKISKDIICPECKELCKYEIKDYKIKLYDCKNGHIKENINLNEFENNQIIDISQIKCDICKNKNKSNTFNNEFYLCFECHKNLCPLCKSIHDKTHSIINYDNKNYMCNKHNEILIQYCINYNIDICFSCSNEHKNHHVILYKDRLKDIEHLRNKMNEFEKVINKFKINLEGIINKLKKIIENMNIIYNINNNILNNYENKKLNYKLLSNLNYMDEYIEKEINNIIDKFDYGNNIKELLIIKNKILQIVQNKDSNTNLNSNQNNIKDQQKMNQYMNKNSIHNNYIIQNNNQNINKQSQNEKISNQQNNKNYINITEDIIYKPNDFGKVKIFGSDFVNNNKKNCKILYNNMEYELKEYFNEIDKAYNNKEEIKIKLKVIYNVTNMSSMFRNCKTLYSLPDISLLNTSNLTNMSYMLYKCNTLSLLHDISKWNTSEVIDMSHMFYECKKLSSLPDISLWNTSKVANMKYMFYNCIALSSLPDISKWNTSNVTDMRAMFYYCSTLSSLPDISKWNISKVTDTSDIFYHCNSLSSLPDIGKWDTSNVTNMS